MRKPIPIPENIGEFISYDPDTGHFIWKEREVKSPKDRVFNARHAGNPAGTVQETAWGAYLKINFAKRHYSAHRIAWFLMTGEQPIGGCVHPLDGNGLNNRFSNLFMSKESRREKALAAREASA